jgi:hypothetical protein
MCRLQKLTRRRKSLPRLWKLITVESVFKQIIFAQYVFELYIFAHLKMFLLKEIAFLYMNYKIQNLFIRPAVDQPVTGISVPCTLLYVHILIILL